ncbi:MAG: XdhC family protein [Gammaproteobacteria bacterium]
MSNKLANIYHHIKATPGNYVLATIIETMGSTYQKAGARMLISESGEFIGLLGGGCFESDLHEHAKAVLNSGKPNVVFYDMRSPEDAIWGLGLGCNGAVRVLLQPLKAESLYSPFDQFEGEVEENGSGVLITICRSDHVDYSPGYSSFLKNNNTLVASLPSHNQFIKKAQQVIEQNKPALIEHDIDDKKISVFYDLLKPPFKLLIIGAGPDALPMTRFAKLLGWHITVVDHRAGFVNESRFPDVDVLLNLIPADLNQGLGLDQFDAMILMTHNMDYDERYFKQIVDCNIPYIGLLGPAKRRDRLLDSLDEKAVQIESQVYGPTGLDIAAQTPEEIALSVIAEIQAVTRNHDGGMLSDKDEPIYA